MLLQVIGLVAEAQEIAGNTLAVPLLDKAMEILKCTELYSPSLKDDVRVKTDEPVASDLISALLSVRNEN